MAKKITIDKLAEMVAGGFKEVYHRTDKGFEETNDKINTVKTEMGQKFNRVDQRLDHIDASLSSVRQDVGEIRKHFVYRYEHEDLMARVKYLEEKLKIESGK